jgi:hypothetical protein
MIRVAILAVVIGLLSAAHASAQMATTDLVPAAPVLVHPKTPSLNGTNITPDNPAALAWGGPSRIAVGKMKGQDKDNLGVNAAVDTDGAFGGFRLVGETFGIAAETSSLDVKTNPTQSGDKSHDVQLSLALGKWLAFGIGAGNSKNEISGDDINTKEVGVSLRLGDVFYVGAGARKDENTPTGLSVSAKRNGTMLGIALRTEGDVRWYLALDTISLQSFDFKPAGGQVTEGYTENRATAQVVWHWFLLGVSTANLDVKDYGTFKPTVKLNTLDIGYAPMHGLTVTARMQQTNVTDAQPTDDTLSTTSVAVAWLF